MRFVRELLTVCAVIGTLAAIPTLAATDAPKKLLAADPNAKDLILKGDAKCTGCHDEADEPTGAATMLELNPSVLAIGKTKHGATADKRTPTCVDCHGESEKHRMHKGSDKPPVVDRSFRKTTKTTADARNDTCMTCHQKDSKRSHWAGSMHQTQDVACNSCHQVHAKKDKVRNKVTQAEVCFTCHKEQRAQYQRPSRHPILEGKVACSDCHNVHGSIGPKLVKRDSTNETCYTCHMEKRGPFARPHEPVTEDCGICHNPHGTTAENLLKQRPPFLCNECHSPHGPTLPQLAGQTTTPTSVAKNGINYTQGRGCVNCHTQIHGSNNPARQDHNAGPGLRLPTPQYLLR
ncbi:MAG: DmsE family decaheme c-type cytochrome [Sulfuritalea sp.]